MLQARETTRDRLVAIKAFSVDLSDQTRADLAAGLAELVRSGLAHPSIVLPLAAGVVDEVPYLVEEFVFGESLEVALRRYGPAPASDASRLIAQIAASLDAASDVGVVHGRLTPRDLLVTPELVRVTGFGLAALFERLGLPAPVKAPYGAPERLSQRGWDRRADVFSLAAIAWELLTGRNLTLRDSGIGPGEPEVAVARPDEFRRALARGLADDPEDRFATARDLAAALEVALTGRSSRVTPAAVEPIAPATAGGPAAPDRPARRRPREPRAARSAARATPDVAQSFGPAGAPEGLSSAAPEAAALDEPPLALPPAAPSAGSPLDLALALATSTAPAVPSLPFDDLGPSNGAPVGDFDLQVAAPSNPEPPDSGSPLAAPPRLESPEPEAPAAEPSKIESHQAPTPRVVQRYEGRPDTEWEAPIRTEEAPTRRPLERRSPRVTEPIPVFLRTSPGARSGWLRSDTAVWTLAGSLAAAGLVAGLLIGYQIGARRPAAPPGVAQSLPANASPMPAPAGTRAAESRTAQAPAAPRPAPLTAARPTPPPVAAQQTRREPAPTPATASDGRATLIIRSKPTGASVVIDGETRGKTPLTLGGLAPGRLRFRLTAPGHQTYVASVTVPARRARRDLSYTLQPLATGRPQPARTAPGTGGAATRNPAPRFVGTLRVVSTPPGARVLLDGVAVGTTPVTLRASAGEHLLRLERDGYRRHSTSVRVVTGRTINVVASLEPGR